MRTLEVPNALCGTYRDVSRAAGRLATQLRKGAGIDEVAEPLRSFDDLPGGIVIEAPLDGEHYFGFLLVAALSRKVGMDPDAPIWRSFFDQALERPWALAACLGQDSYFFFHHGLDRPRRFLEAIVAHWEALNEPGKRYYLGLYGQSLWQTSVTVGYCIGRLDPSSTNESLRELIYDPAYHKGALPPPLLPFRRA